MEPKDRGEEALDRSRGLREGEAARARLTLAGRVREPREPVLPPLGLPTFFPPAAEAQWLDPTRSWVAGLPRGCSPQRPACQGSEQSGGVQRVGLEGPTG